MDFDKTRTIIPEGLVRSRELILKLYYSLENEKQYSPKDLSRAKDLIRRGINIGDTDTHTNYGFAILTEENLGVARWKHPGKKGCLEGSVRLFSKDGEPIEENGTSYLIKCGKPIIEHEDKAWRTFRRSNMSEIAIRKFLEDFLR